MKNIQILKELKEKKLAIFTLSSFTKKIILAIFCIWIGYVLFVPKVTLGTIFFGGIPSLYNLNLAHFFFKQSLLFDTTNAIPAPYAHYQLGRTFFIQGNLDRTISELQAELAYYPEHSKSYYMLGLAFGFQGNNREAIEAFKKYVQLDEQSWAGRNDLAWLLFQAGKIDEALQYIEPVVEKNKLNPWILNTYGVLLMNKGRLQEAKAVLTNGYSISLSITEETWGRSYPGNDPRVYDIGLEGMRASFKENLALVNKRLHVDK
jgi:tetratricopeptide (TPR) repeat protein